MTALRRTTTALNVLGIALGLWAVLAPDPHGLCVAALILAPLAAIGFAWRSAGQVTLVQRRGDKRPGVFVLLFLPLFGLGAVALSAYDVIDWRMPLLVAVLIGGALALLVSHLEASPGRPWWAILLMAAATAWGWGIATEANGAFDMTPRRTAALQVTGKWASHGRSTSYHLDVDDRDAPEVGGDIRVSRGLYRSVAVGQPVCLDLHDGTFGWRWYRPHACARAPAP